MNCYYLGIPILLILVERERHFLSLSLFNKKTIKKIVIAYFFRGNDIVIFWMFMKEI